MAVPPAPLSLRSQKLARWLPTEAIPPTGETAGEPGWRRLHPPIHPRAVTGSGVGADTALMSLTDYLINFALIGIVVLQIRGRALTVRNLALPVVLSAFAASQYLRSVPTAGNDLVLELGLALLGITLGVAAALTSRVYAGPEGVAMAKAGPAAAALWIGGVGARLAFVLWVQHGGEAAVARFSAHHDITTGAAWAAGLVLMGILEAVSRTAAVYVRAIRSGAHIPRRVPAAVAA